MNLLWAPVPQSTDALAPTVPPPPGWGLCFHRNLMDPTDDWTGYLRGGFDYFTKTYGTPSLMALDLEGFESRGSPGGPVHVAAVVDFMHSLLAGVPVTFYDHDDPWSYSDALSVCLYPQNPSVVDGTPIADPPVTRPLSFNALDVGSRLFRRPTAQYGYAMPAYYDRSPLNPLDTALTVGYAGAMGNLVLWFDPGNAAEAAMMTACGVTMGKHVAGASEG